MRGSEMRGFKLHATGNDFLVFPVRAAGPGAERLLDQAARLCDRHRGIGADGLIVLTAGGDGHDVRMRLRNADGSPAEMSGNGIRCAAWVAHRLGFGDGRRLRIATDVGVRTVEVVVRDGGVVEAEVDMGRVTFVPAEIPVAADTADALLLDPAVPPVDAAGLGNPHLVMLVDDPAGLESVPLARLAAGVAADPRFPAGANLEVAAPEAGGLTMRVWERGVGETLSCGTGACAAAAVAHRHGHVGARVAVTVPGGTLTVTLGEGLSARLAGPVSPVAEVVPL